MNIDTGIDLIQFIDNEKKPGKVLKHKKAYIYFNTCLLKTILELSSKFRDNNLDPIENTIVGVNTFCHVFFVLLSYTNNLKLTIFLAERAVLLFTEFVIMSRESDITEELNYKPNNRDAMLFSYKKTIGPIKLNEIENNFTMNNIKFTCSLIMQLYIDFFKKNNGNISLNDFKKIDSGFSHLFLRLSDKTECSDGGKKCTELRGYLVKKIGEWLNSKKNVYESFLITKCILEIIAKMKISGEIVSSINIVDFYEKCYSLECLRYYRETDFYQTLKIAHEYDH